MLMMFFITIRAVTAMLMNRIIPFISIAMLRLTYAAPAQSL
jgi:hypothetical protein